MAVYSIGRNGKKNMALQVTKQFRVFDTVEITFRDGKKIQGEIIYIEEEKVYVTGPYMPNEIIDLREITDIISWNAPESWK